MQVAALIVEYNPLHNGHLYQIKQARKLVGAKGSIIAIMSGNFCQRGELSCLDKVSKANLAVQLGVDLVIELPTLAVLSSANYFAKGAISLINALNCVDYVVCGIESKDPKLLIAIAKLLAKLNPDLGSISKPTEEQANFAKALQALLKTGLAYPAAISKLLCSAPYLEYLKDSLTLSTKPANSTSNSTFNSTSNSAPNLTSSLAANSTGNAVIYVPDDSVNSSASDSATDTTGDSSIDLTSNFAANVNLEQSSNLASKIALCLSQANNILALAYLQAKFSLPQPAKNWRFHFLQRQTGKQYLSAHRIREIIANNIASEAELLKTLLPYLPAESLATLLKAAHAKQLMTNFNLALPYNLYLAQNSLLNSATNCVAAATTEDAANCVAAATTEDATNCVAAATTEDAANCVAAATTEDAANYVAAATTIESANSIATSNSTDTACNMSAANIASTANNIALRSASSLTNEGSSRQAAFIKHIVKESHKLDTYLRLANEIGAANKIGSTNKIGSANEIGAANEPSTLNLSAPNLLINNLSHKAFPLASLKRQMLKAVLNLPNYSLEELNTLLSKANYLRVLAFSSYPGRGLLKQIAKVASCPLIMRFSDFQQKQAYPVSKAAFYKLANADYRATNFYATLSNNPQALDKKQVLTPIKTKHK